MAHDEQHGQFVWTELLTRDPAGAVAFYPEVLGWTTDLVPMAEGDYTLWIANGAPHAGMMRRPAESLSPPLWLPYVAVDDVDGAAVRCQEEGGTVLVEPRDIPGMGRFAVFGDPFGASFAVYRSAQPQPTPTGGPRVGEFSWRELGAGEIGGACDFYAEMFGWIKGPTHDLGPAGIYQLLVRADGVPFAGVFASTPDMPPSWTSYVRVGQLEATVAAVEQRGGKLLVAPMDVPGGDRIAVVLDPEGVVLGLHWIAAG